MSKPLGPSSPTLVEGVRTPPLLGQKAAGKNPASLTSAGVFEGVSGGHKLGLTHRSALAQTV